MSFAPHIKNELHRVKEATEAATPYDPTVATKVILKTKPTTPAEPQRTAVWDTNPWDRFDRKVVLAYTGNQDRIKLLQTEFARVGLNDVHIHWNFNNHFLQYLSDVKCKGFTPQWTSILNNAIGHYSIIKTAYELGCKNCLIMEDDVRFLRDINLLKEIIESTPDDYEVAMYDSHPPAHTWSTNPHEGDQVSNNWRCVITRTSAACYALSRTGMEKMIALYEAEPLSSSDLNFNCNNFSKIYCADPNAARQVKITGSKTNTGYDTWSQLYDILGCNRGEYGK